MGRKRGLGRRKSKEKSVVFELWYYQRMLRISYKNKVTNTKVFESIRMAKGVLLENIVKKKEEYIINSAKNSEQHREKIFGKALRGR